MIRSPRAWLILGLAAAIALWLGSRMPPPHPQQSGHLDERPVTHEAPVAIAPPQSAQSSLPSGAMRIAPAMSSRPGMPSADAPQVAHIRYWSTQARAGDGYSRCRYAREAQQCAALIHNTAPWMRERFIAEMVRQGDFGELPDCRGVTEADIDAHFDQMLLAAEQGHVPAQLAFAAGSGFASVEGVRFTDRLRRFGRRAEPLAWRAFEAGDSDAALLLWRAYNRVGADRLYLAGAVEPDPVLAHALDLLVHDLVPEIASGSAAEAGLDPAQARRAAKLHAHWRTAAFATARPPRYGIEIERMFDWEKRAVDLCADDPH